MKETVTSRFPERLIRRLDEAVSGGHFSSRSEALRWMVEGYLRDHPELFLGEGVQDMIEEAPSMTDEELERMGSRIFKGVSVVDMVAEGRG